tara:strand:+ start:504 stop:1763 length:1260 start_codon:yes stop_codon:yes gene_type:complete
MKNNKILNLLEIKSPFLRLLSISSEGKNKQKILGEVTIPSKGILNDTITNVEEATQSIQSCIDEMEKKTKNKIQNLIVIFEPIETNSIRMSKSKVIAGAKISFDDVSYLITDAKLQIQQSQQNDFIVHIFNYNYNVDGKKFLNEPIDIYGNFFSHELTFLTIPRNILKNINEIFVNADVEVKKFILSSYAYSVTKFDKDTLEKGISLISFDKNKTSVTVFKNSALIHHKTIPIGLHHLAKDISRVCSISKSESKNIVNNYITKFFDNINFFEEDSKNEFIDSSFFTHTNYRKISYALIKKILLFRLDEIFKKIILELNFSSNFVNQNELYLVNNYDYNLKINPIFNNYLSHRVKNIKISSLSGLEGSNLSLFDSCLGAAKLINEGFSTEAIAQNANNLNKAKKGLISWLFGSKNDDRIF